MRRRVCCERSELAVMFSGNRSKKHSTNAMLEHDLIIDSIDVLTLQK